MWKLWYVFISLFSFFFSAYSKKWTTDRERCAKVRCNRGRRERRVFKSSRYTRLWSSRASFSRCSLDDDDDGCEKFEISRGKIKQRAARMDTMMMIMMMIMMTILTIFIFFLFISLSRTHIRIQMHYTDDRTFIEY